MIDSLFAAIDRAASVYRVTHELRSAQSVAEPAVVDQRLRDALVELAAATPVAIERFGFDTGSVD